MLEFIRDGGMVLRSRVLERFSRDPEAVLLSVLHDLCESGLVFVSGSGSRVAYRAATEQELGELATSGEDEGLEELAWALVVHEGPLGEQDLRHRLSRSAEDLAPIIGTLLSDGRIERRRDGLLCARDLVIPLSAAAGWEVAVFDHFQAVVNTIC